LRLFADAHEQPADEHPSVTPATTVPLDVDRVCTWQEEMRRAVSRRESLPAAACGAIARLLERFLDEETAEHGGGDEVRAAIALLRDSSQRNGSLGLCASAARVRRA
jgi:hypothetical protein